CGRGLSELFLSPVAPSAPACAPCGATPHPARLRPTTLPPAGGEGGAVTLDPFYPIVDSADWVRRLVGVGARLIQLRMKDKDDATVAAEARAALKICRDAGATLVVNDFWRVAIDVGAQWVHLGQGDLDAGADVGAIRRAGLKLGLSTHDEAELARALALKPDYVTLGPIY